MAAVEHNLELEAGATWSLGVRYLLPPDVDGHRASALPAGWTATAQWRRHPNDATTLLSINPVIDHDAGSFVLTLTAVQTRSLPSTCVWGVEVAAAGGEPTVRLIEGKCSVSLEIVR